MPRCSGTTTKQTRGIVLPQAVSHERLEGFDDSLEQCVSGVLCEWLIAYLINPM